MGNCLNRKEDNHKSSYSSYMGFKVVSTKSESKLSKIFFICKKRLNRNSSMFGASKGDNPKTKTLFEYEDPVSKNNHLKPFNSLRSH